MAAAKPIDVPGLLDSFKVFGEGIATSSIAVIKELANANAAGAKSIEADKAIGEANAVVTETRAKAELKRIADTSGAAAAVGMNPDAPSYLLTTLSAKILADEADIRDRDAAIQEKLDVKFLDDPLGFLQSQLSVPFDITARNMKAVQTSAANEQLKQASLRFNEQAVVNAAIAQTVTTQSMAALVQKDLMEARKNVAVTEAQLAKLNIDGINIRQAMNKEQWDAVLRYQSAVREQQSLALQAAAGARAEEQLQMQREQQAWHRQERIENLETKDRMQARLNKATGMAGMTPMDIKDFQMLPAAMKATLDRLMFDPDTQNLNMLGRTPARAVDTANELNLPLTPGQNLLRKKIMDIKNGVFADPLHAQTVQHGKPEEKNRLVDMAVEAAIKRESNNIPVQSGVYSPPPLLATLSIPGITTLPITKELQALAVTNPQYPTSATDIWNVAVKMISDKKGTPAELAAQMSMIYMGINSDNISQRNYARLGLPEPTTHNTNVERGGWGNSKVLDMTNRAQLEAELTRQQALTSGGIRNFFGIVEEPAAPGSNPRKAAK